MENVYVQAKNRSHEYSKMESVESERLWGAI